MGQRRRVEGNRHPTVGEKRKLGNAVAHRGALLRRNAVAIGAADENKPAQASGYRITVTVQMLFTNAIQPELSFENRQSFSAQYDFDVSDGSRPSDDVMVQELVSILVEDIFNAAVAQW